MSGFTTQANSVAVFDDIVVNDEVQAGRIKLPGTAPAAGFIGEIIEASSYPNVSPGANNVVVPISSITLTPGRWIVYGQSGNSVGTATIQASAYSISLADNAVDAKHLTVVTSPATSIADLFCNVCPRPVTITSNTNVYLVGRHTYSAGTPGLYGGAYTKFYAVRIA